MATGLLYSLPVHACKGNILGILSIRTFNLLKNIVVLDDGVYL